MDTPLELRTVIAEKCLLFQRGDSARWWVNIRVDSGKWERFSTGKTDIEEARERALELFYEVKYKAEKNEPLITRSFSSIAKAIIKQLEDTKGTDAWKSVYKSYIEVIKNYQIPFFKGTKLDNIKKSYSGYLSYVAEQMGSKLKASTISTHHAALKLILNNAVENGYVSHAGLPVLKNEGTESEQRPSFEISEYRSMIQKLRHWSEQPTHRQRDKETRELLYDYVLMLAYTGIRAGEEANRITWQNVSFDNSKTGKELIVISVLKKKGRKGTQSWRKVVVRNNDISNARKVLERLKNRVNALRKTKLDTLIKSKNPHPLFTLSDGSTVARIDGTFKKFLKEADLLESTEGKERTLYSLRHFYATQALSGNNPISVSLLAKQLGTSIKMIEKHYSHLDTVKEGDVLSGYTEF